ncbi:aminopeptidase N [Bifidobacterium sp. ESL0704]|uniref:aminopeptidase N n=1 Tax=Bifidobacterium sp. ESL0704 TaxID=2983219 RepID=UPI0023FA29FB|nr:aminopeptidase N [Bifidobacterium sp. ESL0704]WEV53319.1 aminopeptidase N [Bifidobacterium sp. ESL0704]
MPGANLTRVEAEERKSVITGPVSYHVDLDLTQGPKSFPSVSVITFDAKAGSSSFADLIADEVSTIELNGETLDPTKYYVDNRIELPALKEHNTLKVVSSCQYSTTGEGLHRSVDPADGNVYLYSQFEVPDARRVYAVFDQPDIKATFDFEVAAPASWLVTSNMPVKSTTDLDAMTAEGTLGTHPAESTKRWVFETTPKMSSYLTAICAGPYAEWHTTYANEDGRTVPMAQYCRQSLKDDFARDADYLFDITKKGFAFYAKTWGVPYPYAKFDQIYVPEYNAGAMENIGMVTIRDSYVFGSKVTDALAERRVVTVLHELAHMWFGDLVTMKWWNDLWLNESFAEFMSSLSTAEATDWTDSWATFTSGEKSWALNQDQLPTTHPITAPINDLHDTEVNFDGITYAKGGSVLKQLVAYVGREKFFKGINSYLNKHQYDNATLKDLLVELEAASGRDLKTWSKQWLEESGINTIAADVEENGDGTIKSLTLTQTAPAEHPVLRAHRMAIGFYNRDAATGKIVRTDRIELDVTGETTVATEAAGKARPDFIMLNDDDLTYTKLRFDAKSRDFAAEHLFEFDDALARAVVWLAFWDMTRDAEFPAERFLDLSLKMLSTEHESTTFRYALRCLKVTATQYVAPARREAVRQHVAEGLWDLANVSEAGSDEQFQLVSAYLDYGAQGDAPFISNVKGLLSGTLKLKGLEIDNNMRWALTKALAAVGEMDNEAIDAELKLRDTTDNREFAYGAKASVPSAEAKAWAWDASIHDLSLTNSQLEAAALGFSGNLSGKLAEPYAAKYFETADWIWENRTFHMAESLLDDLYPVYADAAELVRLGDEWLASHTDAARALRNIIIGNVESSRRAVKVSAYNAGLK